MAATVGQSLGHLDLPPDRLKVQRVLSVYLMLSGALKENEPAKATRRNSALKGTLKRQLQTLALQQDGGAAHAERVVETMEGYDLIAPARCVDDRCA